MADIFISYSKSEANLTIELAQYLESHGYTTWWDTSLLAGDEFPQIIAEEIDKAKAVIVIWTTNSVKSRWVRAEAQLADAQGKLITVSSSDFDIKSIPLPFNTRHVVRLSEREKIIKSVRKFLNYPFEHESANLAHILDDAIRFSAKLSSGQIPDKVNFHPVIDFSDIDQKYFIQANGDTHMRGVFGLKAIKQPAFSWVYYIRGDQQSGSVESLSLLKFRAFDLDSGSELQCFPVRNEGMTKAFAVIFSKMAPGTSKRLGITYFWPQFMAEIIKTERCVFDWHYVQNSADRRVRFRSQWEFDGSLAPVECRIVDDQSDMASIRLDQWRDRFSWIYNDPAARLNKKCAVEFYRR